VTQTVEASHNYTPKALIGLEILGVSGHLRDKLTGPAKFKEIHVNTSELIL